MIIQQQILRFAFVVKPQTPTIATNLVDGVNRQDIRVENAVPGKTVVLEKNGTQLATATADRNGGSHILKSCFADRGSIPSSH